MVLNNKNILKNIATGANTYRTKKCYHNGTLHAEMAAIINLLKNKKPSKIQRRRINLVVVRTCRNGELKDSKPCHHCLKYLMKMRPIVYIEYIYYSTDEGTIVKRKLIDLWQHDEHHISRGFRK